MKLLKKPETPQSKMQEVREGLTGLAVLAVLGAIGWHWLSAEDDPVPPPPEAVAAAAVTDVIHKTKEATEVQAAAAERSAAEQAEAERLAALQQAEDEAERQRAAKKAEDDAHAKHYGFHCLSGWDGSHRGLVDAVKKRLNDPRSFEHDETKTWPVNDGGRNQILMIYRAKNGFGALVLGKAIGSFDNKTCDVSLESVE